MTPDSFWSLCQQTLAEHFESAIFEAFIRTATVRVDEDVLCIISPNAATNRWLKQNTEKLIKPLFAEHAPAASYAFRFTGGDAVTPPPAVHRDTRKPPKKPAEAPDSGLKSDMTFESFVAGQANELPLLAAQKIAQGSSDNISPLFIYGGTGLGKTHLAQAAGNAYRKNFPGRRVFYITARAFLKDFVDACRNKQPDRFKERYHNLDMLIIDDIQYIGGDKERTQEEFFYLFNVLQEGNKEIIITCDRAPTQIRDMNARLTSRFNSGLATHIPPPEYELRVDIVRYRAEQWKTPFSDEVVGFIAEHIRSNVRELQGAVRRTIAHSRFKNAEPSIDICKQALADLIGKSNALITADTIKEKVSLYFNLKPGDLSSKKRNQSVAMPRHICFHFCRQLTTMSLPEIGRKFNRNHTTVLHSCRLIEEMLQKDKNFLDRLRHLEMMIKEASH